MVCCLFSQKQVDVQYGGPTFLHHHRGPRDYPALPVHLCESTTHSFLLCHAVHCFDFPWHMWTYTSTLSALHQDCITLKAPFDFSQVNLGEWHGSTKEESRVSPAECRVKFKRRWRIFLHNRTKYSRCYTDVIITEQHAFFTLKLNYFGALITIKSYNSEVVPEDSMITSLH